MTPPRRGDSLILIPAISMGSPPSPVPPVSLLVSIIIAARAGDWLTRVGSPSSSA